jgi:hypothetical protein
MKFLPESLEAKIERWKGRPPAPLPKPGSDVAHPVATLARIEWAPPANAPPVTNDERILMLDLPRVCAVTKKLWCARYRRELGEKYFQYIRSTVAESRQCVVSYTPERLRTLPRGFITGIEDCPHCGGYTLDGCTGAVWCPDCENWCCYGLTSRSGWFICQCGGEGRLVAFNGTKYGIR